MKVIFMGTPDFSVVALNAIIEAGHDVVAVYTQPPRRAGRGKAERKTPVHARAEALGLPVFTHKSLKSDDITAEMAGHGADIGVVVAYGLILPQAILDAPRLGCLNIHASLLPRWRGAAPIHRAIMAGDSETGVCIMQMDAGLDTGPVLLREAVPITAKDTTATLHDTLAAMGGRLIARVLAAPEAFEPKEQPETGVTYAEKIQKTEAQVDFNRPAAAVDAHIRGLSPFPGAWAEIMGERVKFHMSQIADGSGTPGMVIAPPLRIACKTGAIDVLRMQRAGKSPAQTVDILRGFDIPPGTMIG